MSGSLSSAIFKAARSTSTVVDPQLSALAQDMADAKWAKRAGKRGGPQNAALARNIRETLKAVRTELGDNGKVYRRTLLAIKRAGSVAVARAGGYLPGEGELPSGFSRRNDKGWGASRTGATGIKRERTFPRYDRNAAVSGLRVISAKGRATRTESGWTSGSVDGVIVEQRDAAGNIFDIAGRRGGRTDSGKRLIAGFDRAGLHSPLMRVLLPAVIDTRPEIEASIERALASAQLHIIHAGNEG